MPKYLSGFVLATNKTTDTTGLAATKNKSGNSSSEARHALALLFSPELLPGVREGNKSGNSSSEVIDSLALLFSPELLPGVCEGKKNIETAVPLAFGWRYIAQFNRFLPSTMSTCSTFVQ